MERINWRQGEFSSWELRRDGFWEALNEHRAAFGELEEAMEEGDPFVVSAMLADLDINMLRYACSELRKRLEEAVQVDCAQLLAMSVMENGGVDEVQAKWERWLAEGRAWRVLAQKDWQQIKGRAVSMVCQQIQKDGAALDRKIVREIEQSVTALELADVLKPEVYTRFFAVETRLEKADEEGW